MFCELVVLAQRFADSLHFLILQIQVKDRMGAEDGWDVCGCGTVEGFICIVYTVSA